jgi:hypothetical protein
MFSWSQAARGGGEGTVEVATADRSTHGTLTLCDFRSDPAGQGFGIANSGFGGIPVRRAKTYRFAVHARSDAAFRGELLAVLEDEQGGNLGQCRVAGVGSRWSRRQGVYQERGRCIKRPTCGARDRWHGPRRYGHGVAVSREHLEKSGPMVCGRISCNNSGTCGPALCVFPAVASSRDST